jgi:hypothetical protein
MNLIQTKFTKVLDTKIIEMAVKRPSILSLEIRPWNHHPFHRLCYPLSSSRLFFWGWSQALLCLSFCQSEIPKRFSVQEDPFWTSGIFFFYFV